VITDPPGAVASGGGQRITTPGSLLVPSGAKEMEIWIEKAGYETAVVLLAPPASDSFGNCFRDAASPPSDQPSGGTIQGTGPITVAIGSRLLGAAAGCSSTATQLEPSVVFVKLELVGTSWKP
jgi:hypothetical protein